MSGDPTKAATATESKWKFVGSVNIDSGPITDDTPIVRYMNLSTFLMLLCGRAFIPTLRTLQRIDEHEGGLPSFLFGKYYGHHLRPIMERHEDWLIGRAEVPMPPKFLGGNPNYMYYRSLADIWIDELSKRRVVWCWNRYDQESYAMWQIYGRRGVAVQSTVGRVKKQLEKSGRIRGVIAAVSYAIPRRALFEGEDTGPIESMVKPESLTRPYLFKKVGYEFEKEIRFVLGVSPNTPPHSAGVLIEIDPWSYPDWGPWIGTKIDLAPDVPPTERASISALIQSIQTTDVPEWQTAAEEFDEIVSKDAFTMSDEPSSLFSDLD